MQKLTARSSITPPSGEVPEGSINNASSHVNYKGTLPDISKSLNLNKATRPGQHQKRVNVDFPTWVIDSLDKEA